MNCKDGKIYKKPNTNLPQICSGHLSDSQQEVLQLLLEGKSAAETAKLTNYAVQSVYRLMRDPAFKMAFVEQAKGYTMSLAPIALRRMAQLVDDQSVPHAVQFQAARYLLDRCFGRPETAENEQQEKDGRARISLQELLDLREKILEKAARPMVQGPLQVMDVP